MSCIEGSTVGALLKRSSALLFKRVWDGPWGSVGFRGLPWASLGFRGLPWASVGFRGLPWASAGFRRGSLRF